MNIFHFSTLFIINLISSPVIILMTARYRVALQTHQSYRKMLCEQLQRHSHLLITPIGLVISTVPRLIISLISSLSALSSDSVLTAYPQYSYEYYDEYSGHDYTYEGVYDRRDQQYNSNLTGTNCDCQENPFCVQQAIVYGLDGSTRLLPVPGIYVGCYPVEGLLQSDFRCLYDNLCLQQLINSLNLSIATSALSNATSIYQVATAVLEIISNVMLEQWNNQTVYQAYFNQSQPEECLVTYAHRGNVPYIITVMTGSIGGLTTVYTFVVPLLVKIIHRIIIRFGRNERFDNNRRIPLEPMA